MIPPPPFRFTLLLALAISVAGISRARDLTDADREQFARCLALQEDGRWREARSLAEELVRNASGAPASRHLFAFTNELANLDQRLGNYREAEAGYRASLEMAAELEGESSRLVSQLQNNLAALLQVTGDFEESERLNRAALATREAIEGKDSPATVAPMNNLAALLWCIGDLEGAETLFRRALAIRERELGPDALDTARSRANLGGLHFYTGELDRAASDVRAALPDFRREAGPSHPETLDVLLFLGEIERASGSPGEALRLYGQVLEGRRKIFGEEHAETAEAYRRVGDAERELGRYDVALASYERSDGIYRDVLASTHPDRIEGLFGFGLASLASDNPEAAFEAARRASEVEFANLRAVLRFTDERQRLAYRNLFRSHHLYANLAREEEGAGGDASREVAEFLLRSKGVVFDSLIEEARMMRRADSAGAAGAVEQLAAARARFRAVFLASDSDALGLADAEEDLRAARRALLRRIGLEEEIADPTDRELEDLLSALEPGEVLFDYVSYDRYAGRAAFERRYGVAIVTTESVSFADCGSGAEIDALVDEFHDLVRTNPAEVSEEKLRHVLRSLNDRLVGPAAVSPADTVRLQVCPEGALHFVPFACLVDGDGSFLVEKFDLGYLSASRELLPDRFVPDAPSPNDPAPEDGGAPLLVGNPDFTDSTDSSPGATSARRGFQKLFSEGRLSGFQLSPLRGAEVEVGQLSELFRNRGDDATVLLGSAATEAEVRASGSHRRILHFATHGIYLPPFAPEPEETRGDAPFVPDEVVGFQNPLFGSWLALAGANQTVEEWVAGRTPDPASDGILMANEAAELDLEGTLLVTLSACDTATGEPTQGEGVLGIRRGFRKAGAERVLTTHWPINDAVTVRIMREFYERFDEQRPLQALSATQRHWLVAIRDGEDAEIPVRGIVWAVQLAGPFLLSR